MLKAVFFDAAGTLFHLRGSVGEHYREVALWHGLDLPATAFDAAFTLAWKTSPPRLQTPAVARPDDDRGWWRDLVWRVLDQLVPASAFEAPRELFFADVYEHFRDPAIWALYPEVPAVLETLARSHRLAVVSNFDGRLRAILQGLGLLGFFETLVISSELGADKPHPAIFREALRRLNLQPSEALHAGDDPRLDWAAAEAVQIASFPLERPRNALTDLLALDELGGEA